MSTRKKRTLAGVIAVDSEFREGDTKFVLPAASRTMNISKNQTEIVRGTEFLVDTSECKPWIFHNRDKVWMSVEKCQDLISSIRKNGQKVPIFARKLENDIDGRSWEIIAGRRRWFACNYLGIKIRVKAVDATDRECAILMNLENKDRNDISEFEDAISYKQQLDASLFDSQDEMASALDLKKSKLSKMLSAAKLLDYHEIFDLFEDITLLRINPVYALVLFLEKNSNSIEVVNQKARQLKEAMKHRKIKVNVIINELIKSVAYQEKKNAIISKHYKIGDKVILKANQSSSRKVIFEFNKGNFSVLDKDSIRNIVLEALDEFV